MPFESGGVQLFSIQIADSLAEFREGLLAFGWVSRIDAEEEGTVGHVERFVGDAVNVELQGGHLACGFAVTVFVGV